MRPHVCAALAIAATGCSFTLREKHLLLHRETPLEQPVAATTQEAVEVPVDGATLRGWVFRAPSAERTVVFFYGNAGSVLSAAGWMSWMAGRLGANVLAVDYRGYGFSDGRATFAALGADALRVVDHARARFPDAPLIVMGYSLGTALAVHAAAARPVEGVVLVAPPSSIEEMAEAMRAQGPWYFAFVTVEVEPTISALPQPRDEVTAVTAPLLVVHGTGDVEVPYAMGQAMHARAGATRKELCTVDGADHENVFMGDAMKVCLARFVATVGPAPAR